jgi:hypothetical protein
VLVGSILVLLVATATPGWTQAGMPKPPIGPEVCEAVQAQINAIVDLGRSPNLTEEQKMEKLSASWAESMAKLRKAGERDEDAEKIAESMNATMMDLLVKGTAASDQDKKSAKGDADAALNVALERIKPYVAMMKMMCPNLKVPDLKNLGSGRK